MKTILILLSLLISFLSFPNNLSFAASKKQNFARITNDNTNLYSLPNNEDENILFEIPKSYFVELISQYDETFFKAKYIDIVGYVKVSEVKPVATPPQNPYAVNIRFRVYSSDGINVRTEPYTKNGLETVKGTLTVLDENVIYYGKKCGEEVVKNRGNTWFYCKYKNPKETIYGYVYAGFCDMLTTINTNNEEINYTDNPFFITQNEIINNHLKNNNSKNLIFIFTLLPTFVFLYLLFKPSKIINKEKKSKLNALITPQTKQRKTYDDFEL